MNPNPDRNQVDAKHIEQHLDEEKPEGAENEAVEQVAFADRMLLNKTDLVSEADLERVEKRLRSLNGFAPIMRTLRSEIAVDRRVSKKASQSFPCSSHVTMLPAYYLLPRSTACSTSAASTSSGRWRWTPSSSTPRASTSTTAA